MLPSPREVRACLDPTFDPINMAIAATVLKEGGYGYGAENFDESDARSCTWIRLMYRRAVTTGGSSTSSAATARVKLSDAIRRAVLNPLEVISAPLIGGGFGSSGVM